MQVNHVNSSQTTNTEVVSPESPSNPEAPPPILTQFFNWVGKIEGFSGVKILVLLGIIGKLIIYYYTMGKFDYWGISRANLGVFGDVIDRFISGGIGFGVVLTNVLILNKHQDDARSDNKLDKFLDVLFVAVETLCMVLFITIPRIYAQYQYFLLFSCLLLGANIFFNTGQKKLLPKVCYILMVLLLFVTCIYQAFNDIYEKIPDTPAKEFIKLLLSNIYFIKIVLPIGVGLVLIGGVYIVFSYLFNKIPLNSIPWRLQSEISRLYRMFVRMIIFLLVGGYLFAYNYEAYFRTNYLVDGERKKIVAYEDREKYYMIPFKVYIDKSVKGDREINFVIENNNILIEEKKNIPTYYVDSLLPSSIVLEKNIEHLITNKNYAEGNIEEVDLSSCDPDLKDMLEGNRWIATYKETDEQNSNGEIRYYINSYEEEGDNININLDEGFIILGTNDNFKKIDLKSKSKNKRIKYINKNNPSEMNQSEENKSKNS